MRKKLDWAIDLAVVQNFIFDFSGVTFMDSTGIGVLLGRYKKLKAKGMYVHITGASGHIDKILNTAGIYTIINKIAKWGNYEQILYANIGVVFQRGFC